MKVIIAGSRSITNIKVVIKTIVSFYEFFSGIDEVVSGHAKGVDRLGEEWAKVHNIPIKLFPTKWDDLDSLGAVIKINSEGKKYNTMAGFQRNRKRGEYADALIAIWDGKSKGTQHMIGVMELLGKPRFIYRIDTEIFYREEWKMFDDSKNNREDGILNITITKGERK